MDPRCRVEMMGPLRLVRGDQTLTRFVTQKAAALLAYLALRAGPQAREQVIDAFWPDMDLPAGRNNLSTTLSALRHILEPGGIRKGTVLITSHAHVGLATAAVTTDVADFERLLAQAGRAGTPQERVETLGQALTLYAGDFQPGNYQEWAVRESGRLSARRVEALDKLTSDLEAMDRFAEAAGTARQRLDADPYEETAYVVLIRSLTRAGQTGAAREVAAQFESFFREEFGAPPSPASRMTVAEYLPETAITPGVSRRTAALRPSASSTETRSFEPNVPSIRTGPHQSHGTDSPSIAVLAESVLRSRG